MKNRLEQNSGRSASDMFGFTGERRCTKSGLRHLDERVALSGGRPS